MSELIIKGVKELFPITDSTREELRKKGIWYVKRKTANSKNEERLISIEHLLDEILPALEKAYETTGKIPYFD